MPVRTKEDQILFLSNLKQKTDNQWNKGWTLLFWRPLYQARINYRVIQRHDASVFFYLIRKVKVMWQRFHYLRLIRVATSWFVRWFLHMMKSIWINEKTLDKEEHKRCNKSYMFCKNDMNNWNENHLMTFNRLKL